MVPGLPLVRRWRLACLRVISCTAILLVLLWFLSPGIVEHDRQDVIKLETANEVYSEGVNVIRGIQDDRVIEEGEEDSIGHSTSKPTSHEEGTKHEDDAVLNWQRNREWVSDNIIPGDVEGGVDKGDTKSPIKDSVDVFQPAPYSQINRQTFDQVPDSNAEVGAGKEDINSTIVDAIDVLDDEQYKTTYKQDDNKVGGLEEKVTPVKVSAFDVFNVDQDMANNRDESNDLKQGIHGQNKPTNPTLGDQEGQNQLKMWGEIANPLGDNLDIPIDDIKEEQKQPESIQKTTQISQTDIESQVNAMEITKAVEEVNKLDSLALTFAKGNENKDNKKGNAKFDYNNIKRFIGENKYPYIINCSNIREIRIGRVLGHGGYKVGYMGYFRGRKVVVKVPFFRTNDTSVCLHDVFKGFRKGPITATTIKETMYKVCPNRCIYFILHEMINHAVLEHPNIANHLGYCIREHVDDWNETDILSQEIVSVYEYGAALSDQKFNFKNMLWFERVRHSRDLAAFLEFLQFSPLGSLAFSDMKYAHFVFADEQFKVIDLDRNMTPLEQRCGNKALADKLMENHPGIPRRRAEFNETCSYGLTCNNGICTGFNALDNIRNFYKLFFGKLLNPAWMPVYLNDSISDLRLKIKQKKISATGIKHFLDNILAYDNVDGSQQYWDYPLFSNDKH